MTLLLSRIKDPRYSRVFILFASFPPSVTGNTSPDNLTTLVMTALLPDLRHIVDWIYGFLRGKPHAPPLSGYRTALLMGPHRPHRPHRYIGSSIGFKFSKFMHFSWRVSCFALWFGHCCVDDILSATVRPSYSLRDSIHQGLGHSSVISDMHRWCRSTSQSNSACNINSLRVFFLRWNLLNLLNRVPTFTVSCGYGTTSFNISGLHPMIRVTAPWHTEIW